MATRISEYVAAAGERELNRTISRGVLRGNLWTLGCVLALFILIAVLGALSQTIRDAMDPIARRRAQTAPQTQNP